MLKSHMKKKHPEFWMANQDYFNKCEDNLLAACHELEAHHDNQET